MEREGWPARRKKKDSLVVLPVEGKKSRRVGERKPLSLKLQSTVSRSSESSHYQCQSAFMGHYRPDASCQCPEESLPFELLQFTSKFIAQEKTNIYLIQIGMSSYIQ